jgi:MFS family permease
VRRALGRVAVDLTPLRVSRDYRRLWAGLLVSELGYQFTIVANFIQVFRLTRSAAAVGLTGLVGFAGLVVGVVAAGAFVDAFDRRKTLIAAQIGFMVASAILFAGALAGRPPVWTIYVAIAMIGALTAIDSPTRAAMTPRLVGTDLLPSAVALNQVVWNATALLGPALAGLVIARLGLAWAYAIDLVTYLAMLGAAVAISPVPPERSPTSPTGWAAVREGFSYLRGRAVLKAAFGIDVIAMVFGAPRALFPILAVSQFHRGAEVVGLLFAAPFAGALLASTTAGWLRRVHRQGMAVVWAVVVWGAGIVAFGLVGANLWLGLFFLAVAGAADVISAVFRSVILQVSVPDALRGRLSAIHILVVTGGPRIGDLEAGLVAAAFTPTVSVVSGGVLCIAGTVLLAWLAPSFRRYEAGAPA